MAVKINKTRISRWEEGMLERESSTLDQLRFVFSFRLYFKFVDITLIIASLITGNLEFDANIFAPYISSYSFSILECLP